MEELVIHGTYFTSKNINEVESHEDHIICIDRSGTITRTLSPTNDEYSQILNDARQAERLIELKANQYLLPGFIDLHVHAPQWPQAGLALDLPLADWLNHYTFPLEAKFADSHYARHVYQEFVHQLLSHGTTTAMMFGTIHNDANVELARQSIMQGLRAFVGQVVMDNPEQTPDYYQNQSPASALHATEQFIKEIFELAKRNSSTVVPVITPRFVPSCTDEALTGLGQLATQYDVPIQSHDLTILRQRGTTIAHCPISNIYFGNGVLPVRKMLADGNCVGLGSDISGGYSPSLYHNIRQAVKSSQMLMDGVDSSLPPMVRGVKGSRITMANAFYLATVGGA